MNAAGRRPLLQSPPVMPPACPGDCYAPCYTTVRLGDHLVGRARRDNSEKCPTRPKSLRIKSSRTGSVARDGGLESTSTTSPYAATKSHCYSPRGDPNWFRSRHAEFSIGACRSTEEVIAEAGRCCSKERNNPPGKPGALRTRSVVQSGEAASTRPRLYSQTPLLSASCEKFRGLGQSPSWLRLSEAKPRWVFRGYPLCIRTFFVTVLGRGFVADRG